MLDEDNAEQCRACKGFFPHEELKDNPVGRTGICFQCFLNEYRALKWCYNKLLKNGKKKAKSRKK